MRNHGYTVGLFLMVAIVSGCATSSPSIARSNYGPGDEFTSGDFTRHNLTSRDECSAADCTGEGCSQACCNNMADGRFERGRPHQLIDGIGWVFGIPAKIILWDKRAENHDVSPHTELAMRNYLDANGLQDVKVRVNQYHPGGEWRRLAQNNNVAPAWRYTFGAITTLGYTIFPGRLFGGDSYNPFTNTINLYSDIPAVAIHEGAYAADNSSREYRGTYGALQQLSGIRMWHETVATNHAVDYIYATGDAHEIAEANRILPPLYGARWGGTIGDFVPAGEPLFTLVGAASGHVFGWRINRENQGLKASSTAATESSAPPAIRAQSAE